MGSRRVDSEFIEAAAAELADLISLAAPSLESNFPVLEHLERHYSQLGWRSRRVPIRDDGPPRANLIVSQSDDPTVMFCCHVDTVPAGDPRSWTVTDGRPKMPVAWNGRIFGLGASDSLASTAVLGVMAAQGRLDDKVAVAFTADEEVGAIGARELVERKAIPESVRLVIVCVPSENRVVLGAKGYVAFDIVAKGAVRRDAPGSVVDDDVRVLAVVGQESHSARPADGHSALIEAAHLEDVDEMADDVVLGIECRGVRNKVPGFFGIRYAAPESVTPGGTHTEVPLRPVLEFLRRMESLAERAAETGDAHFKPCEVTLNVGAITTRDDSLVFACDLRPVPGFDPQPVLDRALAEARAVFPDAALRVPFPPLPPLWTQLPAPIADALQGDLDSTCKSAYTEAAIFAEAGLTCVVAGPGNLRVHRQNEYIDVTALDAGAELYERLIRLARRLPAHAPAAPGAAFR